MATLSLRGLARRARARKEDRPRLVDGGEIEPAEPWTPGASGVREVRHYQARPGRRTVAEQENRERDVLSGGLLWVAGVVIAASLVGAGWVAYESQRLFALKHLSGSDKEARAQIIAALPDAGWIAMATVALVAALRGRSSARARIGILLFFGLSLGAQLMYATKTVEGYLVAVIAPVTLAWMLESFVVEVRRWAAARRHLEIEESPILSGVLRVPVLLARVGLWWVRLVLDRKGTWGGVKDWVLDEAPLAPGRTAASLRAQRAIEQAGGVEQAAAQAREAARAETERIRAEAEAEVERVRQEAQQAAEQARQDARAEVEQARAAAGAEVERARAEAAAHADSMLSKADQHISTIQQDAEERLQQLRAEYEQQLAARNGQMARVDEQLRAASASLERLRAEHDLLLGAASGKARLIAAYERLRLAGDPRYGDRNRLAEVARELYQDAGLASEGTARNYLYEHVSAVNGAVA